MLIYMQILGEAIQVQKSPKAARIRQIGVAQMQLLKHTAARDLLASTIRKEFADPSHNPSICFAAPKLQCMLDKALKSIRSVTRDRAFMILREVSPNSNPRRGRISVKIAYVGKGEIEAGLKAAAEIVS